MEGEKLEQPQKYFPRNFAKKGNIRKSNLKGKKGENCVHFFKFKDITAYLCATEKEPVMREREYICFIHCCY